MDHRRSRTSATRRLFEEERSAEIVADSFADTPDPRLQHVMTSLTQHLHDFVKDVGLTVEEWEAAIRYLTATGQKCSDTRQEFILLSDVLGVSMLVETINNRSDGTATEATVEGPFHVVDSRPRELGDTIAEPGSGEPCLVTGRVLDRTGTPVPGAVVDVWQADADGYYDVQHETRPEYDLRGLFTTDGNGTFWFRTIMPRYYPIPDDGPVGELLEKTARHPNRPAHIHFEVSAPGFRTLTTHVFVADSPYIDDDTVFGVKASLVREFTQVDDPRRAAAAGLDNPFRTVDFEVVLGA
ncbi:hydroxyquinol 1,2-dioxygenase [Pseudonocardia yuanmonensis]|uniref:Hydroxyquinol 1,2-dioxygenase n=1 Tax=Pseudonocardia yuanmonensis TaxID=1095914 RepID=A0ABP8WM73_9PSEU